METRKVRVKDLKVGDDILTTKGLVLRIQSKVKVVDTELEIRFVSEDGNTSSAILYEDTQLSKVIHEKVIRKYNPKTKKMDIIEDK